MSIYDDYPQDALDDLLVAAWHDRRIVDGVAYPVLWHEPSRHALVETEPCLWCGERHHHGKGNAGQRVAPHCGQHTHSFTKTGRRRRPGKGALPCHVLHRDYILEEARA